MPDGRGLTRAQFLRRAGGGAAALAAAGGGAYGIYSWLENGEGRPPGVAAAPTATTHTFMTHPELEPPVVSVLHPAAGTADGYLLLAPSSGPGQRGPMIIDDTGRVVWFRRTKRTAMNLRAGVYKGRPVLSWWEGSTERGLGEGEHVVVDEAYREVARFPAARGRGGNLHEFVLTPASTALITAWERVTRNLLASGGRRRHAVIGGVVQELELPSGRVLSEWRSIDQVPLAESHSRVAPQFDYFHINSVDIAPDGDLIVSARNTWAIYKLSRKTGRVVWRLGGKRTDFRMGPGTFFAWQHDARALGDGSRIAFFDDGAAPAVEKQSRERRIAARLRELERLDGARRVAAPHGLARGRPQPGDQGFGERLRDGDRAARSREVRGRERARRVG